MAVLSSGSWFCSEDWMLTTTLALQFCSTFAVAAGTSEENEPLFLSRLQQHLTICAVHPALANVCLFIISRLVNDREDSQVTLGEHPFMPFTDAKPELDSLIGMWCGYVSQFLEMGPTAVSLTCWPFSALYSYSLGSSEKLLSFKNTSIFKWFAQS